MTTLPITTIINYEEGTHVLINRMLEFDDVTSDSTRVILQWIFYAILCQLVDVFGTVSNIINIICFIKQGFSDPINISLLGLAVSDLGSLVPLIWTNICFTPPLSQLNLPFEPFELQYLIGTWPHGIFSRISSWITALITLERCLCITMPLKVKRIVTPKRTTVVIILVYVILLVSVAPLFHANRYAMKFSKIRNKTLLGLVFTDDRDRVERASFAINNVFIPSVSFVIVIVCTVMLVLSLQFKIHWRKQSAVSGNAENTYKRDQKVAKMVTVISAIFIGCYFPLCAIIAAVVIEPGLSIDGRYSNTLIAVGGVSFLLVSANSAANIFIYYNMSSRYRVVFQRLFLAEGNWARRKVI